MSKPILNRPKKTDAPLQIVHDFRFTALNVKDDYSFLDHTPHEEKLAYMKERVRRLHDRGYGGIVINVDFIDYLKSEESFLRVKEITRYAKSLGLSVWIYDEQYYPSGSAGGQALKGHPEHESAGLACVISEREVKSDEGPIRVPSPLGHSALLYAFAVPVVGGREDFAGRINVSDCIDFAGGLCYDAPVGTWKTYCFFVRTLYEPTHLCQGGRIARRYINVRSKAAVERFYDVTFTEGYEKYMDEVWNDVDAVFTDEPYTPLYSPWRNLPTRTLYPSFSMYDPPNRDIPLYPFVPWTWELPDRFCKKYGFDIAEILVDLFVQTDKTRAARCAFYDLLSEMTIESFPEQIRSRLAKASVGFSGHYMGEEGFDVQPFYYGDILEHLATMDIPGCDNLRSEADALRYSVACKLASSAAHISGKDKVMIEASNMRDADQNITPEIVKAAFSMMCVHGVNVITSYYSENLLAENDMRAVMRHAANLSALFDGGLYAVDTLLLYPFEEMCAACIPQGTIETPIGSQDSMRIGETSAALMQRQITFDFINKKRLLACEIHPGYIAAPNGSRIRSLVVPMISYVDEDLGAYLQKAAQNDIAIVFDGEAREIENLPFTPAFGLSAAVSDDLRLKGENPLVTFMHRRFAEYDLYMLMNTDTASKRVCAEIPAQPGECFGIADTDTLTVEDIPAVCVDGRASIEVELPALSPVVICKYR